MRSRLFRTADKCRRVLLLLLGLLSFGISPCLDVSPIRNESNDVLERQLIPVDEELPTASLGRASRESTPINSSRSYLSVSYADANMINYHADSGEITYEYFDKDSYPKRGYTTAPISSSVFDEQSISSDGFIPDDQSHSPTINSIIGDDDRVQINSTNLWPYRATALVISTYYDVYNSATGTYGPRSFRGTGFLMGPNLLVTAGHCVYSDVTDDGNFADNVDNPRFADLVQVYAGFDGRVDSRSDYRYYAQAKVTSIQKEYYESLSFNFDWAAIELDSYLGNVTGYYGKISNWYGRGSAIYSYGYPYDKPNFTMWSSSGSLTDATSYLYRFDMDAIGGQSGSPIFMTTDDGKTYVCGIVTFSSTGHNGGTRINSFIYHYLNSFVEFFNYLHDVGTISPEEYGFADAYPTSPSYENNYVTHTTDLGFTFQTVRYRTGYIHNEYIVMSCIRRNINTAYIEYKFDVPVSMIIVDLSHWRSQSFEWLRPSTGMAELQYWSDNRWNTQMDLLSDNTNLPTDRTNPTTYFIFFHEPTYRFRFYSESYTTNTNDDNRGRICIGDITFFATGGSI